MKRYDEYIEINSPWIKNIPMNWNAKRLKSVAAYISRGETPVYTDDTSCTKVINQATFSQGYWNTKKVRYTSSSPIGNESVPKQRDILLASTGRGVLGKVFYFDQSDTYIADGHVTIIRTCKTLNSRFLYYYLSVHFDTINGLLARGSTNQTELQEYPLKNMPVPLPSADEQDQIVRYLDWQVSKINRLIAAKRKQIKLLEATTAHYLENTIHIGTRNEQLVETGNPWINSAPISWKKVRHKNVLTEKKEVVGENHSQYTLLSLTTKGVIIRDTSSGKGKYPSDFSTYQVVNPSNIVFCLFDVDETPRTVGLSTHTGMITGAYTVYETHDALPEYLLYYFLSVDNKKGFKPLYSGLRKVIGKDVFSRQAIYLPSIEEQKEIVDAIQIRQAKSRNAIDLLEREIESLHDLRTRLISDVVTGQVDVRGIQVPDDEYINNEITEEEFEEESEDNEEE